MGDANTEPRAAAPPAQVAAAAAPEPRALDAEPHIAEPRIAEPQTPTANDSDRPSEGSALASYEIASSCQPNPQIRATLAQIAQALDARFGRAGITITATDGVRDSAEQSLRVVESIEAGMSLSGLYGEANASEMQAAYDNAPPGNRDAQVEAVQAAIVRARAAGRTVSHHLDGNARRHHGHGPSR